MDRETLMKHINMLDFIAMDLHMYLNTHPNDNDMLIMYNKTISNADRCRTYYETTFGPLCACRSFGKPRWEWERESWPWQNKGEAYVGL